MLVTDILQLDVLTSDPVSPADGQIWYNSTVKAVKSYQDGQVQVSVPKSNLAASTDPTTANDNTQGYLPGSRWLNTTANKEFVCLQNGTGAAVWQRTTGYQRTIDIDVVYGTDRWMSTTSGSYVMAVDMIFRGTTALEIPTAMKVLAWADSGVTCGVRVYDVTNANTLCQNLSITNTTKSIIDLGALSNLPTGEAIFEVHFYRVAGSGGSKAYLSAFQIQF